MIRVLTAFALLGLAAPVAAQQVVHIVDPYDPCEKVTEDTRFGLTSLRCGERSNPSNATWLISFDLGRWGAPYSRFTILGGRELETVSRPSVSVGSCRRGCTFFQVESIRIPFDVLFSQESMTQGLRIKAVGGPRDVFMDLSPQRIQAFRSGLIKAGFIEDDGNSASWERQFKWPEPKQEDGELPPAGLADRPE